MSFTREEVASRAGVDRAFIDRICELGIIEAADGGYSEGDVRRARILHSLTTGGMPLETIAEGVRQGAVSLGFVDAPAYSLFSGLTDETFLAAAARTATEDLEPATDMHGSAEVRRHLATVATRRALTTAASRAGERS